MPTNNTLGAKAMVEGAVAAALATILVLIGYYLPPLSIITSLVWFIPIVVVIVRQNLYWGAMSLVVATFLLMMLTQPLKGLLIVLQMGLVALIYGQGFRKQWSAGKIVFLGGLVVIFTTLVGFGLSMLVMGIDLGQWHQEIKSQLDHTIELYHQWGLINDQAVSEEEIRAKMQTLLNFIILIIPGILVSGSLLTALVNFMLVRIILKRLGVQVAALPPFREWQLPWYFVWGVIGALGLLLAGDYYSIKAVKTIGLNILYIYFPVLLIAGLSVLTYFYHKLKIAKWLKIALVLILVINLSFGMMLLITMGLFDPLFNYRRLGKG